MDPRIASLPVVEYAQDLGVMPIREERVHCELQSTRETLLGDQCCLGNPSRVKCWFLGRKQIASKFPMMRVDTSISTRRSPRLERHWNLLKTQFYLQGLVNGVEFSDCGNKKFGYIPSTFDCLTVS
jgi:hypothetical protein